jgi:hypothetical protein
MVFKVLVFFKKEKKVIILKFITILLKSLKISLKYNLDQIYYKNKQFLYIFRKILLFNKSFNLLNDLSII